MRSGPEGAARPIAAVLIALSTSACGYRLVGSAGASFLPDHIRSIVVQPFVNRTTRPEIEQRVTEEVAREFSKRGRYRVVTDTSGADAVLEGAITSYRTSPVQFGQDARATRVEAIVTLQATLRERATDTVLWSQSGLTFREQYDVSEATIVLDVESVALDEIARGAAGALVTAMLEGF
jgi:hypothetical protein